MLYIILFSVVLLLNFLLSLLVLLKNPKKHINVAFFLFVASLISWMVTNFLSNQFTDHSSALFFNKLIFLFSPYIAFSLVYFSIVFPKDIFVLNSKRLFYILVPVFISNALTLANLVITDITFLRDGGTGVVFGIGIIFFAIQFLVYNLISFIILVKKLIKSSGYERVQMQYLIYGIGITMTLVVITNLIIPLVFNYFWFTNVGPFFTIIMVGLISYAIIRHRLLDIKVILARSVMYTALIAIVAVFYTFAVFLTSLYFFGETVTLGQAITRVVLALFVAFTLIPIRNYLEQVTDRIFFKGKYDPNTLVFQLTKITASTISLEELMKKTLRKLVGTLRITYGSFVIYTNRRRFITFSQGQVIDEKHQKTINALYSLRRMVIFDEEKGGRTKDLMRTLDAGTIVPLFERREKVGMLILGEKKSGQIYSPQAITVLEIFGPVIAVAIRNASSYEEIKNFNFTLKKEVQRATKNLKSVNEKLKELDKQKDEFMAIASHELKTPVTSVKLYVQLLRNKFKKSKDLKSIEAVEKMDVQLNKLTILINDLLDVTKIEEGRLRFDLETFDLNEFVKEEVKDLQRLSKHKIKLNTEDVGHVHANRERIGQVLTNFITNAVKYSPKANKIIIKTKRESKNAIVSVQDFGTGLTPKEQEIVFERFNRAGQEGPGGIPGLGLGLYISKEIVTRHNGKIWVESKKGKGSTFYFSLPLKST